ncbi:BREX-2 system adenine-specific DNA-methyltransferase PglX [Myxococcota bacterium]
MKPADRAKLTAALRDHVAKVADDLHAKMRTEGVVRERAKKLHADEQVGDDFVVWTDLLARRAAVLWVLKSVYVRVLEDRALLDPGRILDVEAQQLFERLAPNLGETAFLCWVYRDLASTKGGLPELFTPQPAEIALPADELSRELLAFWRHRDPDTGAHWSFADEKFEGELMGDLYQDLDPVVKDRFSLCQTPDFVRAFILDRTLAPAIEKFSAEEVRLLDPACGSGHFLIDGLRRLVAATGEKHPDWEKRMLVTHCLERVVGIDLNDYACALARARLVMTAAEISGVETLCEASLFHPHVYWADGLEQVEKGKDTLGQQLDLLDQSKNEVPRACLTRPEVRAALRRVLEPKFHAVVANPPYALEKDKSQREYHRQKTGARRRYLAASGKYSLATVFTERSFQLAVSRGHVGLIIPNNFMTRAFGRGLVEGVFAQHDLHLVVDLSGAILADSGFEVPTIMVFASNETPTGKPVRVAVCRKGDTSRPLNYATGNVWVSTTEHCDTAGYQDEFAGILDCAQEALGHHPWCLSDVQSSAIKDLLEDRAEHRLGELASLGITAVTGEDSCFVLPPEVHARLDIEESRPLVVGATVRDWGIVPRDECVFPYDSDFCILPESDIPSTIRFLWRFKPVIRHRRRFGVPMLQRGLSWYELQELYDDKLRVPRTIVSPAVSTHNQFVFYEGGSVFNRTAPVIKLRPEASLLDHYHIVGLLNSSVLNFWMRNVLHIVGGRSSGTKRQSEPWAQRMDFSASQMEAAPITEFFRESIASLAERLSTLAKTEGEMRPAAVLAKSWEPSDLGEYLAEANVMRQRLRCQVVALQEELDWTCYAAFGLVSPDEVGLTTECEPIASEHRPFAIRMAQAVSAGTASPYWFEAMNVSPTTDVPDVYDAETRNRITHRMDVLRSDETLSLLESPEYKRKWEPISFGDELNSAALAWLSCRLEEIASARTLPATSQQLASAVQGDSRFLAVGGILQERRDVDVAGLVRRILIADGVGNHPSHVYTASGLAKRRVWEDAWELQRREDAGERIDEIPVPPDYSQGSRGKSTDFLKKEYWTLRGKLDVPKERFIVFTEVPGRERADTLYGWAGWTPLQRLKAILAVDEELEDGGVPLADRIALLDSAWRLLPDVAHENPGAASRLKAELQSLVGTEGPSEEMLEDWRNRFPPPGGRGSRTNGKTTKKPSTKKKRGRQQSEADIAKVQEES